MRHFWWTAELVLIVVLLSRASIKCRLTQPSTQDPGRTGTISSMEGRRNSLSPPQTWAPLLAKVRTGEGRGELCVSHSESAKESTFSLALQGGEASSLNICIQAVSQHFGGHCLGKKKIKIQTNKWKTVGKIMTCQCPKPRQEQSTPASTTLIVTQGGKIPQGHTPVAQSWA